MATYWVLATEVNAAGSSHVSLFFLVLATTPSMWDLSIPTRRDRSWCRLQCAVEVWVLTSVLSLSVFFIQGNRFRAVRKVPEVTELEGRRPTQHLNPGGADPSPDTGREEGTRLLGHRLLSRGLKYLPQSPRNPSGQAQAGE